MASFTAVYEQQLKVDIGDAGDALLEKLFTGWISGGRMEDQSPRTDKMNMVTELKFRVRDLRARTVTTYTYPPVNDILLDFPNLEERYCMAYAGPGGELLFDWIEFPSEVDYLNKAQVARATRSALGLSRGVNNYKGPAWAGTSISNLFTRGRDQVLPGTGNVISLHATSMNFKKTSGTATRLFAWALPFMEEVVGVDAPSSSEDAAQDIIPLIDGVTTFNGGFTELTSIPTDKWDDGTALVDIPPNKSAVAVVHYWPASDGTGWLAYQYAQETFGTIAEAIAGFNPRHYLKAPSVKNTTICKGYLYFDVGETDPANMVFVPANYIMSEG